MTLQISDDYYDHAFKLEKEWKSSLPRLTDKELLAIFPEAKQIVPGIVEELEIKQQELVIKIKEKLIRIRNTDSDDFSKWFWREWIKNNEGAKLLQVEKQIIRQKRLLMVGSGKTPRNSINEEQIQEALQVPIENLINGALRKSGKTLCGLCPLHQEKHPSFYIYPQSNSFYCFGCNRGGDVINFVSLLHDFSFKEAINYLTN